MNHNYYTIEIYSRWEWKLKWRVFPVFVRQWRWRCVFRKGGVQNIVATGGEGYYNKGDLETALNNLRLNFGAATVVYIAD